MSHQSQGIEGLFAHTQGLDSVLLGWEQKSAGYFIRSRLKHVHWQEQVAGHPRFEEHKQVDEEHACRAWVMRWYKRNVCALSLVLNTRKPSSTSKRCIAVLQALAIGPWHKILLSHIVEFSLTTP